MRGYWLMLQNELILAWRRYRLVVLALVFLLFGIEAPLVAKLTPALLKSIGQGMTITLPKPTSVMAWQQYYKNMTQIGLFVLAIVASGTVSRELNEGTLVILVAKGLRRNAVIMAKYTMALLQWVVALLLAFGVTYAYTAYYFPDELSPHPWLALWPLLWFGVLWLVIIILGSTLSKSGFTGFLLGAGVYLGLTLLNLFKAVHRFNPVSLTNDNLALLTGTKTFWSLAPAYTVTLAGAAACLVLAMLVLKKRRL